MLLAFLIMKIVQIRLTGTCKCFHSSHLLKSKMDKFFIQDAKSTINTSVPQIKTNNNITTIMAIVPLPFSCSSLCVLFAVGNWSAGFIATREL